MVEDKPLAWLLAILERRRDDGSHYYPTEDLFDFLPAMLLSFGFDPAVLTPRLEVLIGSFARRAGVEPNMSREQTQAAIRAHLEAHPLNRELVFEFTRGLREERVSRGNERVAASFAKFLAQTDRKLEGFGDRKRPPEGAVAASPLARFLLRPKDEG